MTVKYRKKDANKLQGFRLQRYPKQVWTKVLLTKVQTFYEKRGLLIK